MSTLKKPPSIPESTKWKVELHSVPAYHFHDIDGCLHRFSRHTLKMYFLYLWQWLYLLKIIVVYVLDFATLVIMIDTNDWSNHIYDSCKSNTGESQKQCMPVPFKYARWIFLGGIFLSFLFLCFEYQTAKTIVKGDLVCDSYTNNMAYLYQSTRRFRRFCFFHTIKDRVPLKHDISFFCLYHLRTWKHILIADGPRQALNAWTLYAFYLSRKGTGPITDWKQFSDGNIQMTVLIATTLTTVIFFAWSALTFVVSLALYPLLYTCYIRGNLETYCLTKVNALVTELIQEKGIMVVGLTGTEEHIRLISSSTSTF